MRPENQARRERRGDDEAGKPRDGRGQGTNQGIVRDERGQEQPADKERAQRVSKTRQA